MQVPAPSTAGFIVRPAALADRDPIKALLDAAALPVDGIAEHLATFLAAVTHGRLIGAIGLETYGEDALLRSAVVAAENRNAGVGSVLYDSILEVARARDVQRLVLLTTTAERYFGRKGFAVVDRASISGPVTTSAEFQGACPDTAVCMALVLA